MPAQILKKKVAEIKFKDSESTFRQPSKPLPSTNKKSFLKVVLKIHLLLSNLKLHNLSKLLQREVALSHYLNLVPTLSLSNQLKRDQELR